MSAGIEALLGGVLLVAGRRLFWLFVAGVGFVIGLSLAPRLLPNQSEGVILVAALAIGLLGALIAQFAQKAAVSIVGFLGGGWLALWILRTLAGDVGAAQWVAFVVGGIIGVVLLSTLFEWGLALLSSLVGANLLTSALLRLAPAFDGPVFLIFLVLFGVGVLIQARSLPR
ncbi:MAG: hypothetical protein QG637_916 [Chloroflexota bacterium]|nr:hypothetical protein [Chloroflexota bacterium]